MIILEKVDEVYVRVKCDIGEAIELKEYLSVYANNFKFNPRFRARIWNGKISFFDMRTRLLPFGLLAKFDKFCKMYGYEYKFDFPTSDLYNKIDRKIVEDFSNGLVNDYGITPYDYQIDIVKNSIENKKGIILSPTASGKSLGIYLTTRLLLTQKKERKILLVVPTVGLVEQMYNDFVSYGWEDAEDYVEKLYSGMEPDFEKNVLITTWQSIVNKHQKFFSKYEALIVDEVHGAKALSIQNIAKKCTNAKYRIGYTGTLNTSECDKMSIIGYIGPLLFKTKSVDLIDRGILSKIKIANILLKYPEDVVSKNKNRPYTEEIDTINEFEDRNKVFDWIFGNIKDGENTLVLCTQISHLEKLQKYLEEILPDKYMVENIYGKTKIEEREYLRQLMNKENNMVLIGTYATMSTGINIKKLHNVIFASSYKSKIKILQSIGRGLRKHEDKDGVIIWDLVDDLRWEKRTGNIGVNYVFEHWLERMKYYKENEFKTFNKTFKL